MYSEGRKEIELEQISDFSLYNLGSVTVAQEISPCTFFERRNVSSILMLC